MLLPLSGVLYVIGMIDFKYNVRRYIAEYSEETEELIAEHELIDFDLNKFKIEFGEINPEQPMFGCYPISPSNISFLEKYLGNELKWDFQKSSFFVEAHAI